MTGSDQIPFALGGLDHIVLRVADMARAIAFYGDVLGAVEERRVESIGLVQLRAGRSLIDLVPLGEGERTDDGNVEHFALTISPFEPDTLARYLAACGIDSGEAARRYGAEGFGPSVYIKDPDGNVVELKGPAEDGRPA